MDNNNDRPFFYDNGPKPKPFAPVYTPIPTTATQPFPALKDDVAYEEVFGADTQPTGEGGQGGGQAADGTSSPAAGGAKRSKLRTALLLVSVLILAFTGAGLGVAAGNYFQDSTIRMPESAASGSTGEPNVVADVAEAVMPAVVSIRVRTSNGAGTGSGFVVREDGYIVTNDHVVSISGEPAEEIVVVFFDGSQERAEVVGSTAGYDLAILKVDRDNLPTLALADSSQVRVGEQVIAVGAPLGLDGTVTTGIVSAVNRPVTAVDGQRATYINAIQTDAAINPGNSGGPLLNINGEVIGVNTVIAQASDSTSGSIGLGFSISSNQVRRTSEQLIETGTATHPIIGVSLDGRYTGEGVMVAADLPNGEPSIVPDGPAEAAGIEPGDIILAIDGKPVTEANELISYIRSKAPGEEVVLTVRYSNGERDISLVLDEAESH